MFSFGRKISRTVFSSERLFRRPNIFAVNYNVPLFKKFYTLTPSVTTIRMKATMKYFHLVLLIILCKVGLTIELPRGRDNTFL